MRIRFARTWKSLGVLAACVISACAGGQGEPRATPPRPHVSQVRAAARADSNVTFDDYAGSEACAPCHADLVARWRGSPMHRMTREAPAAEVRAPFAGETFSFKGDSVRLLHDDDARFFEISQKGGTPRYFKLTRVIGGRVREDYAGIQVAAPKKNAAVIGDAGSEWVMPVTFVLGTKKLRYKGYSVMVKERPQLHEGPEWNKACIFCHNTVPYIDTALGAFVGKRAPYQGEVVDPLLPPAKRYAYRVTDPVAFRGLVARETQRLGIELTSDDASPSVALAGVNAIRGSFRASHLVETGIGCESCHNGARAHAESPAVKPSLVPSSPALSIGPDGRTATHAETVNRVCARCHQVLFSGYPHTWEGGDRHGSPGGSNINSGEARDLMLGRCQSQLACTTCHDPHAQDNAQRSLALTDAVCTQCHKQLATKEKAEAHSHHSSAGEGGRCLACHMPKKNLALDGGLSRYHRIGSPTDQERVLLDRPLECALCHADKSVRQLTTSMKTWWKKSYDDTALERLYGSLDANVLIATVERGKPHEVAAAAYLLRDSATMRVPAMRALGTALTNPIPLVRSYAKASMERLGGKPFVIDLDADPSEIEQARQSYEAATESE